jgi:hypothetical protein
LTRVVHSPYAKFGAKVIVPLHSESWRSQIDGRLRNISGEMNRIPLARWTTGVNTKPISPMSW